MTLDLGTIATVVTAISSTGAFGAAVAIYLTVRRHDRVLFGEQGVDEIDGVVPEVYRNKRVLEEEGLR
jgi:hypothetical protein